jgi:hypothetical protein
MHCRYHISPQYLPNKVKKCWHRRMNVRSHIPVWELLIDGAQLKRQMLHNPCSATPDRFSSLIQLLNCQYTVTITQDYTNCKSEHTIQGETKGRM